MFAMKCCRSKISLQPLPLPSFQCCSCTSSALATRPFCPDPGIAELTKIKTQSNNNKKTKMAAASVCVCATVCVSKCTRARSSKESAVILPYGSYQYPRIGQSLPRKLFKSGRLIKQIIANLLIICTYLEIIAYKTLYCFNLNI